MNNPEPFAPFLEFEYSRIYGRIVATWGKAECRKILFDLLNDSRGGKRQGFGQHIVDEISGLLNVHDATFPQFAVETSIIPEIIFRKAIIPVEKHTDGISAQSILATFAALLISAIIYHYFFKG